jgi:hypothetical protein
MRPHPIVRLIRWLQLTATVLILATAVAAVNHKTSKETFTVSHLGVNPGL